MQFTKNVFGESIRKTEMKQKPINKNEKQVWGEGISLLKMHSLLQLVVALRTLSVIADVNCFHF